MCAGGADSTSSSRPVMTTSYRALLQEDCGSARGPFSSCCVAGSTGCVGGAEAEGCCTHRAVHTPHKNRFWPPQVRRLFVCGTCAEHVVQGWSRESLQSMITAAVARQPASHTPLGLTAGRLPGHRRRRGQLTHILYCVQSAPPADIFLVSAVHQVTFLSPIELLLHQQAG